MCLRPQANLPPFGGGAGTRATTFPCVRSILGRIVGLSVLTAGLTAISLPPEPAAAAVGTARPIAIAVDSDGTSYVGYASGGALTRINNAGARLTPIALDEDGPVVGLAVDSSDYLWVAYDDAVTKMNVDGDVIRTFPRTAAAACADDDSHSSSRFGGLALGQDAVYVASRCSATIEVYDRGDGAERAVVALPGNDKARGLAWLGTFKGRPPRLFARSRPPRSCSPTTPRRSTATPTPSKRTAITKPGTRKRPIPAGVTVDKRGQLSISDLANQAIYRYDTSTSTSTATRCSGTRRTPPTPTATSTTRRRSRSTPRTRAASPATSSSPTPATAGCSGGTSAAATRSGCARSSRRSSATSPTRRTRPTRPTPPTRASRRRRPRRKITATADATGLRCDTGVWTGDPATYTFKWLRDGVVRSGVTGNVYPLSGADNGTEISCRVTARTTSGDIGTATSAPWYVGTPVAPVSSSDPTIVGTPARDNTLLCDTGGWTGLPTPSFSYVWLRDGVQVGNNPTYVVKAADLGASLSLHGHRDQPGRLGLGDLRPGRAGRRRHRRGPRRPRPGRAVHRRAPRRDRRRRRDDQRPAGEPADRAADRRHRHRGQQHRRLRPRDRRSP